MTFIAIEIEAKGKLCGLLCRFLDENHGMCHLYKMTLRQRNSLEYIRTSQCIADEMPVICDTCSNNESCGGLRAPTYEEECIKADYSHWAPQTKGKI